LRTGAWLGIETSGDAAGIALVAGGRLLAEASFLAAGALSRELLPGIERLLRDAGGAGVSVTGIAVSTGPGSYTGLRIGIATAEGLAAGWGAGLKGVGTLLALAVRTGLDTPVLACVRARKAEVFACLYGAGTPDAEVLAGPGVYAAGALPGLLRGFGEVAAVGSGRRELSELPGVRWILPDLDSPPASVVATTGEYLAAGRGFDASIRPAYLRGFMERAVDALP